MGDTHAEEIQCDSLHDETTSKGSRQHDWVLAQLRISKNYIIRELPALYSTETNA